MSQALHKFTRPAVTIAAVAMSVFILYTSLTTPLVAMRQRAVVLMLSLFMIFLIYPALKKREHISYFDVIWALLGAAVNLYVIIDFQNLVNRMGMPNQVDLILGGLCIVLVLEATRRSIGWPLPIVTAIFLLYNYFGQYIPGTFGHRGYDITRIINQMYLTTEGIFGVPIGVVVTIVFLFILFGAFLEKSGGGNFFINLAVALAGRAKGGPAKIAVIASGLMGTISGSSIANVVTTGSFTIPLMKKIGYRPEFAASVEAAASTGGQIMPPIMGAGAFVMSEFTQIPYLTIIAAAAIPALLYYLSIYMNVHFEACRTGLEGMSEDEVPKTRDVLREGYVYILPIIALVVVLILGYSPARAALVGMGLLVLVSMIKASTRMKPKDFLDALASAGMTSFSIVAATACAGMIVGTVSMTGLGIKFSNLIGNLAGGREILGLFFTMIACLILGMALPTTANYIVQAAITAPALVALGVPLLTAHLFVFYFGVFADITPPVCLAAYAGAGIAKADPMKAGLNATRNVTVAYLVPYLFVYFPALLGKAPAMEVVQAVATAVLAVIALSAAFSSFLQRRCYWWERFLLLVAGALLIVPEPVSDLAGAILFVALYIWQRLSKTRPRPATAGRVADSD